MIADEQEAPIPRAGRATRAPPRPATRRARLPKAAPTSPDHSLRDQERKIFDCRCGLSLMTSDSRLRSSSSAHAYRPIALLTALDKPSKAVAFGGRSEAASAAPFRSRRGVFYHDAVNNRWPERPRPILKATLVSAQGTQDRILVCRKNRGVGDTDKFVRALQSDGFRLAAHRRSCLNNHG